MTREGGTALAVTEEDKGKPKEDRTAVGKLWDNFETKMRQIRDKIATKSG